MKLISLHIVINQSRRIHDFLLLRDPQLRPGYELVTDGTLNLATQGRLATSWENISGGNRQHVTVFRDIAVHVGHLAQVHSEALLGASHVASLTPIHQVLTLLGIESSLLWWHLVVVVVSAACHSAVLLLTMVAIRFAAPWRALTAQILLLLIFTLV